VITDDDKFLDILNPDSSFVDGEKRIKDYDFYVSGSIQQRIVPLDEVYTSIFFKDNLADSLPMATYLAPKIVEELKCESVLDVGCASGHWLNCFKQAGLKIIGLEGSKAAFDYLTIDKDAVEYFDLREKYETVHDVDLVLSIEVAEHIEEVFADNYVDVLTKHGASNIIMTAAPPGQGGEGHVNLQPKEYWMEKLEDVGYRRDLKLEKKIRKWTVEGRTMQDVPLELRRLAVVGDDSGSTPGQPRPAHNWNNDYDALYSSPDKMDYRYWANVWIPWWFPRNLICFKKWS
jgi:SAM-dependent methyltransferase